MVAPGSPDPRLSRALSPAKIRALLQATDHLQRKRVSPVHLTILIAVINSSRVLAYFCIRGTHDRLSIFHERNLDRGAGC